MIRTFRRSILICAMVLVAGEGRWWHGVNAASRETTKDRVGLGVGYLPPAFSATDLNGHSHSLDEAKGNVLVLHFWASWCPYCRGEIPKLKQVQQQWASRGVKILTISTDADLSKLKTFLAQQPLPYPVIADAEVESSIAEQYGISGIPVTYVLTTDGHIFARLSGSSDIVGTVQRALNATHAPRS